jgi:Mg-chelatase subunit ChlD
MSTSIIRGSISQIAKQNGASIAETFMSADVIIIVDTSSSMGTEDSAGGRSRYDVACMELEALQNSLPGRIAVISFSDDAMFCPSGQPFNYEGGTNMKKALEFAKVADVPDMSFILISDGEAFDEAGTLRVARTYKNKIDVIYVGPEDRPYGRDFLYELAKATGGQSATMDRAKELEAGVRLLLKA